MLSPSGNEGPPDLGRRDVPKPHRFSPPGFFIVCIDAGTRRHQLGDHAIAIRDQHGLAAGSQANVFS